MTILERVKKTGIVPVVVLDDEKDAVPLAKALLAGGIDIMEITFRTSAALASIKSIAANVPEILLGAGTVLTIEQLQSAADAGIKFMVSPGSDSELITAAQKLDVFPLPGAVTPTEIMQGLKLGIEVFKFFPASSFGGVKSINALSAPFTKIQFIPTGGVSEDNMAEYLNCKGVAALGGSWMVKSKLINEGRFDEITELTKQAIAKFRSLRPE